MRFRCSSAIVVAAVLLTASVAYGAEGVTLVQTMTTGTTTETHQIQMANNRMRIEITSGQVVLFDVTRQVIDIINVNGKSYSEITKADLERLSTQMSGAMSQMQAAMANMPPEQRAQMEAMMRGRGMGAPTAPIKITYRKIGADKVGQWACDKYEGSQNGQKMSEVCTVDPKAIGLTAADMATFGQLAAFAKTLMPGSSAFMDFGGSGGDQMFSGIPVRTVSSLGGRSTTIELSGVKHGDLPDSLFVPPSGFQKTGFPGAMGAGRGR